MCGIVGYVGARQAQDVVLAGLRRLEYRGHDSAGIAVVPLQLFTCELATLIGHDVDHPRNLAKSVTVE